MKKTEKTVTVVPAAPGQPLTRLRELVDNIPVDKKAKATPMMKDFIMMKVRQIRKDQETIAAAQREAKKKEILESYKEAIKFKKSLEAVREQEDAINELRAKHARELDAANKKMRDAQAVVTATGMTPDGRVIEIHWADHYEELPFGGEGEEGEVVPYHRIRDAAALGRLIQKNAPYTTYNGRPIWLTDREVNAVNEVKELLKAVESISAGFQDIDVLESRLVFASNVGEVMAIMNAVLGIEVFGDTQKLVKDKHFE